MVPYSFSIRSINLDFLYYNNYKLLQNIACYPMIAHEVLKIGSSITLFKFKCVFDAKNVLDFHFVNRQIHHAYLNTFRSCYTCNHASICSMHMSVLLLFYLTICRYTFYVLFSIVKSLYICFHVSPNYFICSRDVMPYVFVVKYHYKFMKNR